MAKTMLIRTTRIVPLLLVACLFVACGGSDDATEPIATTASAATAEPAAEPTGEAENAQEDGAPTETPSADTDSTSADSASAESTSADSTSADEQLAASQTSDAIPAGLRVLAIDQGQSEARFLIDEVLLGADKTVVGVTSQVTGTISVDPADPASTEISAIIIDARDLTTDSSRRNRSIQRQILRSAVDENRYITFVPTAIDGLPETVSIGEPFSFSVTGELTVRGQSRSETFDLSVTPNSPDEVSGLAATVIRYEDYGISIPSVPAVASVEEEVRLELAFVAIVE